MSPNKYQICSKTVMDTSDPGITFDEDGISNHYWDFQNFVKPKWINDERGINNLKKQIQKIKKDNKGNDFDCLLGLSGGVDSSYLLHKVVTEFDLRPLVFHVDGGWNSEIAVNNINVLIDKLNLDLYTEVINWEEMRDFQLSMFESGVPHIDVPQDMAFIGVLYKFAEKYNIKYILNGGNISTECVLMPLEILYWGTDMLHIRDILSKFSEIPLRTFPFSSVFYHKIYLRYFRKVKVLKPLNNIRFIKKEAIKELNNLYGWKPYPQKHFESNFTRFFESYWLPTRFNYDMRRNQFSSLILTEQMTRDEALNLLKKPPYQKENLNEDLNYIASKLRISVNELKEYHQMPKKFYWDYKNQSRLFRLGEKALKFISNSRRGGAF